MKINPQRLNDSSSAQHQKTLAVGMHGAGKTTQFLHMARKYGRGLLISGEGGLKSIAGMPGSELIDVVPFSSWEEEVEGGDGVPFKQICQWLKSGEGRSQGYAWVGIDSLTELSDRCYEHFQEVHKNNKNTFALFGDYGAAMVGSLKWLRDLDMHVMVTCLMKSDSNDNGEVFHAPLVKGNATQRQIAGVFDNVFYLIRVSDGDRTNPSVARYLITDDVRGYHGKARDPRRRLKPIEQTGNIVELYEKMEAEPTGHEAHMASVKAQSTEQTKE